MNNVEDANHDSLDEIDVPSAVMPGGLPPPTEPSALKARAALRPHPSVALLVQPGDEGLGGVQVLARGLCVRLQLLLLRQSGLVLPLRLVQL